LPPGVRLLDVGEHRLKDLARPRRLFQVVVPGLPEEFPPLKSLDTLPNNLPRQLTSFVGRVYEMREVKVMVPETPLLTLTGPGGVGKTRLAIQVAAELVDAFEDGLWLVELAPLTDPDLVGQTVASTLGVSEPGRRVTDALVDYLRDRHLLLLLDNCEHVLGAVAEIADTLLRSCASLRILATSREALGIGGEALYPVPSLSLPDPRRLPAVDQLSQFEGVRLFTERARAVQPAFTLTERNAMAVVHLCQRLDGIPLAVELAAARVKSLPVDQIAARLDDRFRLLTGGSRTALPRHQTLRAAMEWSYDLLSPEERGVLRRIAVFAGGLTLEAAESVSAGAEVPAEEVFDLVTRLVDKSLVVAAGEEHGARYRLLDTIREYALGRLLESGEADEARRRHLDWYLTLVEQARPEFFRGPEPGAWLERLDLEHDNLRAALAWSDAEPEGGDAGLRLAAGLWRFWEIRGYVAEGRGWLEKMLGRTTGSISLLRANALTGAGVLAYIQGDYRAAFAFHEESLALHRRLGDPHSIAYAANNLANAAVLQGDYARARALYEEALGLARESGDWRGIGFGLINLADVFARQEEYAEAEALFEKSLAIFSEMDDRWGAAYALDNFGLMASRRSDFAAARTHYERALALSRELGDARATARTLTHLADLASQQGDVAGARSLYAEGLGIRQTLGDMSGIASALERLAWVATGEHPDRSVRLLGAAQALRQTIGASLNPSAREEYDRRLASLQERLGEERFKAAWEEGRKMTPDDAVADARELARG
jgi:predicted ATPase/Tfp pilus assembly protein PilF